jgi:hypothetical protein
MPPVFSQEVWICATVYVQADSAEEADAKLQQLDDMDTVMLAGGPLVSGIAFDSPDLPEVSLSPNATVHWGTRDGKPEEV